MREETREFIAGRIDTEDSRRRTDEELGDPEEFCPDCFAGMESSEHHEKCVAPADDLSPAMRELADGIAEYVRSFMSCVDTIAELREVDFDFMAEDFVESCVVGIMRVDVDR